MKRLLRDFFDLSKAEYKSMIWHITLLVAVIGCYTGVRIWQNNQPAPPPLANIIALEPQPTHFSSSYPTHQQKQYATKNATQQKTPSKYTAKSPKDTNKTYQRYDYESIELNSVTLEELNQKTAYPTWLTQRIIKYRELLGGYVSLNQISEVYGWDSTATVPNFKLDTSLITKFNINKIDYETLRSHPYVDPGQAKMTINYRNKIGKYADWEALLKVYAIDSTDYQRLKYYFEF